MLISSESLLKRPKINEHFIEFWVRCVQISEPDFVQAVESDEFLVYFGEHLKDISTLGFIALKPYFHLIL